MLKSLIKKLNKITSVYLVLKKISILLLILSNDICSIFSGKGTLIVHRQLQQIFKYINSKPDKSAFKKFEKYIKYRTYK